jgi:RNA polymerase sigma-70 factor, ECF subfamily
MTTRARPLGAARIDTEDSDEALMERIAMQDEGAFRLLAGRQLPKMLNLAQKLLGSAADADEIAQEALLRVWINARRFDPRRSRLGTWLYRIVYNLSVDRLRRPRAHALDEALEVSDPAPSALDALARRADLDRLAAAMAKLPERQRAALLLFYHEEMSGPDAAEILGLSLRAFWSLLQRARQMLAREFDASLSRM